MSNLEGYFVTTDNLQVSVVWQCNCRLVDIWGKQEQGVLLRKMEWSQQLLQSLLQSYTRRYNCSYQLVWIWIGYVVRSQYWLLYTTGGVCACYWVFEPQIRRLKSVMVSAWTCDSLSWFQSTIVFTKIEFLNCSMWAVGTMKHLVLLVVGWNWRICGLGSA